MNYKLARNLVSGAGRGPVVWKPLKVLPTDSFLILPLATVEDALCLLLEEENLDKEEFHQSGKSFRRQQ